MRGHADAATLAAFREELLSARKAAQVSAHLAACPRCAALEAQLAEVTTLLNRATAPPMPDALTARIQAALAAEAAARTPAATPAPEVVPARAGAAGHDGTQGSNGHRSVEEPRRTRWHGHDRSWLALRVAAVAAAVAVIAGGGYGVSQLLTGSPAVTGAASGSGALAPKIKVTGPVPRAPSSGLNAAPASGGGNSNSHSSIGTEAPLVIRSGTNYQPRSLGAQASAVLKHLTTGPHPSARPFPVAPAASQASLFPDLQACLIHISNGQHPLLVDLAHYLGHPALIVVLPGTNGAQPKALVIAPGCNSTTARVLTTAPLPLSG